MELKARIDTLVYKRIMLACFLAITIICIAGGILLERFLYKKEVEKNRETVEIIALNILILEKQIEQHLLNATTAFELFLKNCPDPTTKQLQDLSMELQVSKIGYYNADGTVGITSNPIPDNERIDKDIFTIFKYNPALKDIMNFEQKAVFTPITVTEVKWYRHIYKAITKWDKKENKFFAAHISNNLIQELLMSYKNTQKRIEYISLSTPSGKIITDSEKNVQSNALAIDKYTEKPIILNNKTSIDITLPFGGLQQNNNSAKIKGLTNLLGEYFYVLNVNYSKNVINRQIVFLKISLISIAILGILVSYLATNAFYTRKQHQMSLQLQARQIHHDIATPIQTLDSAVDNMIAKQDYSESRSLRMKSSVNLIKGIIADLYYLHDNSFNQKNITLSPDLLYPIIESVADSAQNIAKGNKKVILEQASNPFDLVDVDNVVLRRALLNLVKNGIDSTGSNGIITVNVSNKDNSAVIKISDNGTGMSREQIDSLLSGNFKTTKKQGKGLGFAYAKKVIEHLGGTIKIVSEIGKGTTQTVSIPIAKEKPKWFIDKIDLSKYVQIAILDDNHTIHDIYKQYFRNHKIANFYSVESFKKAMQNLDTKATFFIMDYCLDSSNITGLDLIRQYNLSDNAILATSMYLEQEVKEESNQSNIKLVPKSLVSYLF